MTCLRLVQAACVLFLPFSILNFAPFAHSEESPSIFLEDLTWTEFQQSPAFICTIGTETHMHAHFVLAHPEPKSFNAHLVKVGTEAFASNGWATSVSDLYAARDLTRASALSTTQTDWMLAVLTYRLSNATPRPPLHCIAQLWMKSVRSIARTLLCCNIRCGGICRLQF